MSRITKKQFDVLEILYNNSPNKISPTFIAKELVRTGKEKKISRSAVCCRLLYLINDFFVEWDYGEYSITELGETGYKEFIASNKFN